MSASVWYEEVSAGLIEEIKATVRIRNAKGELTPLPHPEKSIIVRKPEEDLKFEVFPCVSIYVKSHRHDTFRYDPTLIAMEKNPAAHSILAEEQAVPFNLSVQLDFWARYQTDMDTMTREWLFKHFRQFNLDVIDDGGTPRSVNCMSVGDLVRADLFMGKERLYHSLANYTIWVEIDNETRYNVPMVTTISVDTHGAQ